MHVPAPGRVQYYQWHELPFVPTETKVALRVPKAFAESEKTLSYLELVKKETQNFLNKNIGQNYFNGKDHVSLKTPVGEAEAMFAASEEFKQQVADGAIKDLHDKCSALGESTETSYIRIRDSIESQVVSIQARENQIYGSLLEKGLHDLQIHGEFGNDLFATLSFSGTGGATVENLNVLSRLNVDGAYKAEFEELVSLVGAKAHALKNLHTLQQAYVDNVELKEPAAEDELNSFKQRMVAYQTAFENYGSDVSADSTAVSQIDQVSGNLDSAISTFQKFRQALDQRENTFQRLQSAENASQDDLENFRMSLIQHLSTTIVVKEHRQRYQVEQFDRMMTAGFSSQLANKRQSLDKWCTLYADLLQSMIENSHGNKSPYIKANYDHFDEATVRPINSTFFYYFFSAEAWKRGFAKWMLSTAAYPNHKMKQAYMRFFS